MTHPCRRPTSCAPCSCSRRSPTSSSRCCASTGILRNYEPGPIIVEGEPATCFYVLIDGELAMSKLSGGQDIETNRTSQRGVYCGAWRAFTGGQAKELRRVGARDQAVAVLRDGRAGVRPVHEGPVPDGGPPARRDRGGHRPDPPDHRQPGEAAGAGPVVGRADPSAEQSRRGHRTGRRRAARPDRRHARETGDARRRHRQRPRR